MNSNSQLYLHSNVPHNMYSFDIDSYVFLLKNFEQNGYTYNLLSSLLEKKNLSKIMYLRHDIDVHPIFAMEMAKQEYDMNIGATYFILLNSHYNVLYHENIRIIKEISKMGHEIGLHYDLSTYPSIFDLAYKQLHREVDILSDIVEKQVQCITTHEPSYVVYDSFKELIEFIHPHSERFSKDMVYVSESRRKWRDDTLKQCFTKDAPKRVMFATHPYAWLCGKIYDNVEYLNKVIIPMGISQYIHYYNTWLREGLEEQR